MRTAGLGDSPIDGRSGRGRFVGCNGRQLDGTLLPEAHQFPMPSSSVTPRFEAICRGASEQLQDLTFTRMLGTHVD
jgi:hypothetical protein